MIDVVEAEGVEAEERFYPGEVETLGDQKDVQDVRPENSSLRD